jgi:hypothetical protein
VQRAVVRPQLRHLEGDDRPADERLAEVVGLDRVAVELV